MKKLFLSIVIAAFVCSVTIFAAPILKLNLEKGKEYKIKTTSSQTMAMNANGMQMNTEVNSSTGIRYLAESLETDYLLVKVSFDSIITNVNNPYKSIKINTNKPGNQKNLDDLMSFVNLVLVKNPLEVKMSYTGKVIEILNIKAVTDSAMKQLDSLPEPSKSQMKPAVEMTIGADMLKVIIESPLAYLSGNAIVSGDKWESKITIKRNGMELSIGTKYKCKSISDNKAELTGDVVIECPENAVMSMNGNQIPYEMRGMGTTEASVDLSTGLIIKSKGKQKMQGSMTFNGSAMPMDIDAKIEVEAVK